MTTFAATPSEIVPDTFLGTLTYDDQGNWVGAMAGPSEEVGVSENNQFTTAYGLNDLGAYLGGLLYNKLHPYDPNYINHSPKCR